MTGAVKPVFSIDYLFNGLNLSVQNTKTLYRSDIYLMAQITKYDYIELTLIRDFIADL